MRCPERATDSMNCELNHRGRFGRCLTLPPALRGEVRHSRSQPLPNRSRFVQTLSPILTAKHLSEVLQCVSFCAARRLCLARNRPADHTAGMSERDDYGEFERGGEPLEPDEEARFQ